MAWLRVRMHCMRSNLGKEWQRSIYSTHSNCNQRNCNHCLQQFCRNGMPCVQRFPENPTKNVEKQDNPTEVLWCEHISNQSVNVFQDLHMGSCPVLVVWKSNLDPIGKKKIVTKMYGTGNKHGKTQRNFLTKKNPSDIWKFWNWCRRLSILPLSQVSLTTPTTNPISAYFQSPQSWIPTEFLKIFDFQRIWFSAAPSLGNHLSTSTAGRIVGVHPQDWIATSPTGLVSCENPTFFCPYVGCPSRGLFVNENPGLVPDMFQVSQIL